MVSGRFMARGSLSGISARRRIARKGSSRAGGAQALLVLLIAVAGTGCGSFFNLPDRVAETQTQVTDVQRKQEALSKEVTELRALIEQQEALLREIRADQNASMAEIRSTIEVLRNQLD